MEYYNLDFWIFQNEIQLGSHQIKGLPNSVPQNAGLACESFGLPIRSLRTGERHLERTRTFLSLCLVVCLCSQSGIVWPFVIDVLKY